VDQALHPLGPVRLRRAAPGAGGRVRRGFPVALRHDGTTAG
jgi:hypothetical protein